MTTARSLSILTNTPCLLAIAFLLCSSNLIFGTYAEISEHGSSIENDVNFDENNKIESHYIVFPANRPDCPTYNWDPGSHFTAMALEGDALSKVFPHYRTGESYLGRDEENELDEGEEDNRCLAACLEKGTDISVAGHTMPHFHYYGTNDDASLSEKKSDFESWFHDNCQKVETCFINYAVKERTLPIYWIHPDGSRRKQMDLEYSERKTRCFFSFIGHSFEAEDEESGFLQRLTIGHVTTLAFGTSPPSSSQRFDGREELVDNVKVALAHEWHKHKGVPRTFSSLGFAKGRLPDDVFASMAAFYYNNRHNVVNEEWEGKGFFVNWWQTDVKFVAIPWSLKKLWQLRLMELVSDWAGVEVEETSMYGLRQYETGARLLSHVDRKPTHAVSLIVNIAQENLANPWPVEVFDHADRLHEVDMEAGDIVYYESAKNLHSRNRPLTCKRGGCRFINLFTHYRPVDDGSAWFSNLDDLPNRPPPLLDGQSAFDTDASTCKLLDDGINGTVDNLLGIGKVQCEDQRLGSYLSPTMFKLQKEDDLYRWWLATEDANFIGFDQNGEAMYKEQNGEVVQKKLPYDEKDESYVEEVRKLEQETKNIGHACFDLNENCELWASWESNECEKNSDYMSENCPASCGLCKRGSITGDEL